MQIRRFVALALATVLVLSGCGDDDDDDGSATTTEPADDSDTTADGDDGSGGADEEAYVAEVAAAIQTSTDFSSADPAISQCISEEMVNAIGYDQISAAGVTAQQLVDSSSLDEVGLSVDDPAAFIDAVAGCGDVLGSIIASRAPTPDQEACVRAAVSNEIIAEVLVVSLLGEEPSAEAQAASAESQACFD
jgi:hypothetical protein